ncbi:MAG: helix-turn-helix domain-containing protein [Peptostreptococcaceae bacterium]
MHDKYIKNSEKATHLQDNYREWKINSMNESGYFLVFQGFLENDTLKDISGNALKLYLYLGVHSNNFAGVVWHSNERIALYFNKSQRTIRGWMKELEDMKLIKRMRLQYDGIAYTFLLPYKCGYNDKYLRKVEGVLINKNKKLYIKIEKEYLPISSGLYLEVYDTITSEWIFGKIYAYKSNFFIDDSYEDIKYIFKSLNEDYEKDLRENIQMNIKATI